MADSTRIRLGRIRCLVQAVEAMQKGEPFPEPLCYVPVKMNLECQPEEPLHLYSTPKSDGKTVSQLPSGKTLKFVVKGKPRVNEEGLWIQLISPYEDSWILVQPFKSGSKAKWKIVKEEDKELTDWMDAVEQICSLQLSRPSLTAESDEKEVLKLQYPPPGWSLEADEELARFMTEHGGKIPLGHPTAGGNEYLLKVEASSGESEIENLFEADQAWESDGDQGSHWLKFYMKPGSIIQKFTLLIDEDDGSYLPKRVVVLGGPKDNLSVIQTRNFGPSDYSKSELNLFPTPMTIFYPIVQVVVKSCYQGGIDTRIQGIKLVCNASANIFLESDNLREDIFTANATSRWPKLEPFSPEQLLYRGLALKRVSTLINKDLSYLLPQWSHSSHAFGGVTAMRQLWPLCTDRNVLIDQMLQDTVDRSPSDTPVLYINRIAAKQHRDDPTIDPEQRKTVFNQILDEINKHTKPSTYNYRWAGQSSQWWECKFLQEGVIDQGGGFRDSLSEIAEELCPPSVDADVPLPLFIRSPNQSQDSSNVYRDGYIPNPSCDQFSKYFFVGQLMGGAFRSQETLVLSMPQFIWKHLVGEPVTWERDFVSVDSAELKLIDSIESMQQENFEEMFEGALNFTTVLSNGDTVNLVPSGEERFVTYNDRLEYCELVKEVRMKESEKQINAIKEGLSQVVPSQVLSLMTWQELEERVCGNPEISIETLKKSTRYDSELSENSPRVKVMWQALESFTNEERSRFLRFITGRRRLPVTIYIDASDTGPEALPTSATCSNALYLPSYTTVEQATQKLRYAAYNCVAIDTDMSPWEE